MALAVVLMLFNISGCEQSVTRTDSRLKVITTIPPLYSFTKNVTEDLAIVKNLLPSGAGPHEYSLSPNDVKRVAEADILIINGAGLETWLGKLIRSVNEFRMTLQNSKERLLIVDTSKGIPIIENDPHIWLSPKNAMAQIINIRDAMEKADPGNSSSYTENAARYLERLEILDNEISEEIKTWESKQFVAFHPAFEYFAEDYGLRQAAVIQLTHEIEPSPRQIAHVIETIKANNIKSILTGPQYSHKIVKSIANDLNLQVYSLDTMETGLPDKQWYEERMRSNLAVLKKALKGSH